MARPLGSQTDSRGPVGGDARPDGGGSRQTRDRKVVVAQPVSQTGGRRMEERPPASAPGAPASTW